MPTLFKIICEQNISTHISCDEQNISSQSYLIPNIPSGVKIMWFLKFMTTRSCTYIHQIFEGIISMNFCP